MSLEVREIHTYYGLSHVLFGLSFSVNKGELVCLLGRNGAGKTTTLRSIMGLTSPSSGSVRFKGRELVGLQPFQVAREGVGFVFGDRRIFPGMTVRQNLEVGRRSRATINVWSVETIWRLFPRLKKLESNFAGYLSGGEQQMLAIARSLMGNPELLLLDEPSEGLAPLLVRAVEEQITRLKGEGISVLLAEQNIKSALRISDRGYVIDKGRFFFKGTVQELRENEDAKRHLVV